MLTEAQTLTIDITLCGTWAGIPATLAETCPALEGDNTCYTTYVINDASSTYANAYFELNYINVYATDGASSSSTSKSSSATRTNSNSPTTTITGGALTSSGASATGSSDQSQGGAMNLQCNALTLLGACVISMLVGIVLM